MWRSRKCMDEFIKKLLEKYIIINKESGEPATFEELYETYTILGESK